MAVGIGWVKDVGKFCENRYSIVTPEGEILEYTKLHPFSYSGEDRYFQGGTALPVCEYRGYYLGVQICYRYVMICVFRKPFRLCPVRQI